MKLFKFPILAIMAVVTMFAACSDDGYWDGYDEKGDVYSLSQSTLNVTCTPGAVDSVITVQVIRNHANGDVTLPLDVTVGQDGAFAIPSEVTFANGSKTADINIAVNPDLTPGSYTASVAFSDSLVSVSGNAVCDITLTVSYNWVSMGTGQFFDGFMLGNNYYNVEIMEAEGFERYRVMRPYNEGMNADHGEWADWRTGKYPEYIEFWTAADGETIDFTPFNSGILYEATAGQAIGVYPYYYFSSTVGNGAFTCWYDEAHTYACISPYYYISGVGGWNYTTKFGCIQIILPTYGE